VELSDVSHPFLVQAGGHEVPLEKVWRDLSDPSLIGAVSLHADETLETEIVHETAHGLRIVPEALAFEKSRNGIDRPQLVDDLRLDPVRRAFSS